MQQSAQFSIKNRWLEIWTQPRAIIRDLLNTDSGKHAIPIMLIAGVVIGLRSGPIGIIVGPIMAFIILYVYAFLLRWVGSWFGGQGTGEAMRTATIWGYYLPTLQWRVILLSLTVLGNALQFAEIAYILFAFLVVMSIWTWTVHWRAVAEAHQFTVLKAFFATFIVAVIVGTPALVAIFALGGF